MPKIYKNESRVAAIFEDVGAYPVDTLMAVQDGNALSIVPIGGGAAIIKKAYSEFFRENGTGFDDVAECLAYLSGVLMGDLEQGVSMVDVNAAIATAIAPLASQDELNTLTGQIAQKADSSGLAPVALSGEYDDLLDRPTTYHEFPVMMEENADLSASTAGGYQWSIGNGNNVTRGSGVVIHRDCELISVGLSCEAAGPGGTVEVMRSLTFNTDETVANVTLGLTDGVPTVPTDNANGLNTITTPVPFSKGQRVNFKTVVGNTATNGCHVVAWFRAISEEV